MKYYIIAAFWLVLSLIIKLLTGKIDETCLVIASIFTAAGMVANDLTSEIKFHK